MSAPAPHGLREALKPGMRVLDFGCGYGRFTAELLAEGVDVWGVDIDPDEIDQARQRFTDRGLDPGRLAVLDKHGHAPFSDGSFDLVFTEEVLEHVAELDLVAEEIARLTRPGGVGVHVWPAKWNPVELHLGMPFVHWLPKNGLRRAAVYGFTMAGVHAPAPRPMSRRELAERRYRYSVEQTFYRPLGEVAAAFTRAGLTPAPLPHPRLASVPARAVTERIVRTFWSAGLLTRR